ncbi:MAG TPA: PQQ-binding-like beta-propeller repeat protein [Candidatus Hydrogenedentes bacterium]|nr:PQQ-binding-like beta-propeller repeat protein [Candidatus Hydrogenedentota bacterium]
MALSRHIFCVALLFTLPFFLMTAAAASDQPQWGQCFSRNMVSEEAGLPASFDPQTGHNVLWTAPLGGGCYSSAIVAEGCVFIGCNNSDPKDPHQQGDRGTLYCLNEKDGSLKWQLLVPRIGGDDFLDWPGIGICSPPTVENGRVYTMTNRTEVVCLDLAGMTDGNGGVFQEEGRHMTPAGSPAVEPGAADADILWLYDLRNELGVYPHDSPHTSILIDGDFLYLNTCNGTTNTHREIGNPEAPAFIVLNKHTGRLVAREREGMSRRMFHSTWAPPSLGEVQGKRLIFFGGPDGICYAFYALKQQVYETVQDLELCWRFDCDPTAPKENVFDYLNNNKEGPSLIMSMPVFMNGRIHVTAGGDIWWGKRQSWLKCVDPAGTGDVTAAKEIWSYEIPYQCSSTPAVTADLVFVGDDGGQLHCVDAKTGGACWVHKFGRKIWGSALVADGKVFAAGRNGTLAVFENSREKKLLWETRFPEEINGTPTAANGVLYVATLSRLYALKAMD